MLAGRTVGVTTRGAPPGTQRRPNRIAAFAIAAVAVISLATDTPARGSRSFDRAALRGEVFHSTGGMGAITKKDV